MHLRIGAIHFGSLHLVIVCLTCSSWHGWNLLQRSAHSSIDCLPWVVNACPLFSNMGLVSSWGCLLRISCTSFFACLHFSVRLSSTACSSFLLVWLWGSRYNYISVTALCSYICTDLCRLVALCCGCGLYHNAFSVCVDLCSGGNMLSGIHSLAWQVADDT